MTQIIPSVQPDPRAEIERLSQLAKELADKLRAHRDMLAQRGMGIPSGSLDNMQNVSKSLDSLTNRLGSSEIELQQLHGLARTTELINSTLDLDLVLDEVVDTVIALTGAERGYIVLKDPVTDRLDFRVARDNQQHKLAESQFIVSRTIIEQVAREGELIVTTSAADEERWKEAKSVVGLMLRSILCVPLKRKGQITGVIYADNRLKPDLFSEREKRLVQAFANQAAVAIENARLFERVRAAIAEITALRDFLQNVFASIASGVITTGSQDEITTINDAAARILGIPGGNVVGQSVWSVLPTLYEGFDKLVAEVREHNRQQTVEVDPVLDTRGQVSLNLKLSPLKDAANVTQGVAIVLDDLTELKQRQEQLSVVKRYLPPQMVDDIKKIDELELGGVEREISVLFCDVRGFTTFSEKLEPEELMETINKYLTAGSEAIHHYEGIIDKFMGDAIVGLYNTQLNPQADHALRAVYAGLAMVENVKELHQRLPEKYRLFYGIGVHTGTAILGNVGSPRRKEFTAIGNSLQLAKLLQENALGGEVIISPDTYAIVKDAVTVERIEPRRLKDQRDYMVMYRIAGLTGQ
ncbi:MAG: GAF domain-containing protein [Anaerolineae bacterium]|nr:GAF domain-containing protein [Anaerolineae bacterium]